MIRLEAAERGIATGGWRRVLAVGGFFILRLALLAVTLKLSAWKLQPGPFATYSQFFILLGFLNLISAAGLQNGLIRQIAARPQAEAARSVVRAALCLWLACATVICVAVYLGRVELSRFLVGDGRGAEAAPLLALLACVGGVGQIICAVMTGSGRVMGSLAAQTLGLVMATAAGAWWLIHGEALGAVIAYGAGSLATPLAALWLARTLPALTFGPTSRIVAEIRQLLGLAGSFAVVASLMPLALFAMRRVFELRFGLAALSYWLVANRVSDVNTQLLGLYMAQVYLPIAASAGDGALGAAARRAFFTATAWMLCGLAAFAAGRAFLVPAFLSATFLPASGGILIYLAGDALRVATSIASNTALARRRIRAYVAIEAVSASLFCIVTLAFIGLKMPLAPNFGYLGANAVMTTALIAAFFHLRRRKT